MDSKIGAKDIFFSEFAHKASEAFYIPSLQRPYTWDAKKDVSKLFDDIVENEAGYFIGSIVSVLGNGSTSKDQIIDGQQRLTTLYLLLIAIRDVTLETKPMSQDIVDDVDDYLIKYKKNESIVRLSFSNESSNLAYLSLIEGKEEGFKFETEVQKKFIRNYEYLKIKVVEYVGTGKYKIDRLKELVALIASLQLIFIECKDKSAAFSLFESINATGVDLSTNDLIKNSIFETLHKDSQLFGFVQDGWNSMFEEFDENGSILKTFIRHHWISTVDYTSHSRLFDDFLKEYKSREQVIEYAKSLFDAAPIYKALRNGNIEVLEKLSKRRNDSNECKEALQFLGSLGVDQVYSVLLNMYYSDIVSFKKSLTKLLAFQFLYKYIPGSPSVPEKYFADFCKSKIDKNALFSKLKSLCEHKEVDFTEKVSSSLKYVGGNTIGIQFLLEKYIYFYGPGSKFALPTIEHIIPQEKSDPVYKLFEDSLEAHRQIHKIGNLTILEQRENTSVSEYNQEFEIKYPLYSAHIFKVNKSIKKYRFDQDPKLAIDKRSAEISSELYNIFMYALERGKWPIK